MRGRTSLRRRHPLRWMRRRSCRRSRHAIDGTITCAADVTHAVDQHELATASHTSADTTTGPHDRAPNRCASATRHTASHRPSHCADAGHAHAIQPHLTGRLHHAHHHPAQRGRTRRRLTRGP